MISQEEVDLNNPFACLVLLLRGWYYEGMPLDDLAHRLRVNAESFILVLSMFEVNHDA